MRTPSRWSNAVRRCFGATAVIEDVYFFESKKNQVSLLTISQSGGPALKVIGKLYSWGERKKEERVLRNAGEKGLAVPSVRAAWNNILFLEYVQGSTMRSLLGGGHDPCAASEALACWVASWHLAFRRGRRYTLLKADMRLQNFICKDTRLYGVDFEESRWGDPLDDIADMAATLLTFPWKGAPDGGAVADRFVSACARREEISPSGIDERVARNLEERERIKSLC
ncbi:MAG: hypothetical protein RDV48_21175 [Candidatus Eremiobacteraeota bacterium]|nr:hypothetical protein [Candidatus Eremiobacteraeota bacterium]